VVLWVVSLLLVQRAGRGLPWHESGEAPDNQEVKRGHSQEKTEQDATAKGTSNAKAGVIFAVAALVTLVAGVVLERSGDAIANDIGLSGVLFGATVLAAATSLPEVSTGLTSVRKEDYQLAISDIFGGNAFLPTLFLLATLLSGKAVLPQAQETDIYLTAWASS
jgi:cation:H+ antiporter